MKKSLLVFIASFATSAVLHADTITLWDFNLPTTATVFPSGDADPATGTFAPFVGSGTLTNIGATLVGSFGNPPAGGSTATTDPWVADNSAFRMGTFPAQGTASKSSGMEFFASTVGFEKIQVSFDQENSATASRYWRVQYTTNAGAAWKDYVVLASANGTPWVQQRLVDFTGIAGVANNPDFGFRYVSEFISSAAGTYGVESYTANSTGSTYGTGGTLWLDMVTLAGTPLDTSNNRPTISEISFRTNRANQVVGPISFTVGDVETAASDLQLSALISNSSLVSGYSFNGTGANRSITLTLVPDQLGMSGVTVTATDAGGKTASTYFDLMIWPTNTPPTIGAIPTQIMVANSTTNIAFTVFDSETSPENLNYTIVSSTADVISASVAQVVANGSNMSLNINATTNDLGSARISIIVGDGVSTATNSFILKIVQPEPIVLWNFNSPIPDTNAATGTFAPVSGSGVFTNIGSPTFTFGNIANSDTSADECSIRLTAFPAQGVSNKTAGIEFRFSTAGYKNVALAWDQQNSSTASRYWRIQYTLDGVNFVDHIAYTNLTGGATIQTGADFLGISGANNNPNFGVRIVSEFESTIDPSSTTNYVGVQASRAYGTGGTCWFDMITVTGEAAAPSASLNVSVLGGDVKISWSASATGTLYGTASLTTPDWQPVTEPTVNQDGTNVVTITNAANNRFFRLQ